MAHCKYHVGVTMVAHVEAVPFEREDADIMRIRLTCPILGCFWVAHEFDPEKVNKRTCCRCGKTIKHSSLSNNVCGPCKHKESKERYVKEKRYATKIVGRPKQQYAEI